jgi:CRISPR/Cas system CMR-associated protein Cmr1 (group 7 of RAMP superfamily)
MLLTRDCDGGIWGDQGRESVFLIDVAISVNQRTCGASMQHTLRVKEKDTEAKEAAAVVFDRVQSKKQ